MALTAQYLAVVYGHIHSSVSRTPPYTHTHTHTHQNVLVTESNVLEETRYQKVIGLVVLVSITIATLTGVYKLAMA